MFKQTEDMYLFWQKGELRHSRQLETNLHSYFNALFA